LLAQEATHATGSLREGREGHSPPQPQLELLTVVSVVLDQRFLRPHWRDASGLLSPSFEIAVAQVVAAVGMPQSALSALGSGTPRQELAGVSAEGRLVGLRRVEHLLPELVRLQKLVGSPSASTDSMVLGLVLKGLGWFILENTSNEK
jgi:hypothetical protein